MGRIAAVWCRGGWARFFVRAALVATVIALLPACGDHSTIYHGSTPPAPPPLASDFVLLDVNPTSPSYDTYVSPRDYLGKVSAFYFGHAET